MMPLSVTVDADNILWLRGQTPAAASRSVSDTLDRIVTEARTSGRVGDAGIRSVVGTINIAGFDRLLETADRALRAQFFLSLARPIAEKAKTRGRR